MHLARLLPLCASLLMALAEERVVYEPNHDAGWTPSLGRREAGLAKDALIRIDVALAVPEAQVQRAEQALQAMSDPRSPGFSQHWTRAQVRERLAPPQDSVRAVARWLDGCGIPRASLRLARDRGHLFFDTTVDQAERLLDTRYYYSSTTPGVESRDAHVVSGSYSLPLSIARLVDFAVPSLPQVKPRVAPRAIGPPPGLHPAALHALAAAASTSDCFAYMSPACLRQLYAIPELAADAGAAANASASSPQSSLGLYQGYPGTWLGDDLDGFFRRFQPALVGARPQWVSVDGSRRAELNVSFYDIESNLDSEYAMALTAAQTMVQTIAVGGPTALGNTNLMLAAFDGAYCADGLDAQFDILVGNTTADCGTVAPPQVVAITSAWNEANFTDAYVQRQCLEYLKLALQGVTVLAGSGDRGTEDQLGGCYGGEEAAAQGPSFSVNFPASCPYVVAVGGTLLGPTSEPWAGPQTAFPAETAFVLDRNNYNYTSAGGFSRHFPTPAYQQAAVEAYLADPAHRDHLANLSAAGYFDRRGRGYPDVSAVALNYLIVSNGQLMTVSGTSASTPVWAALIAQINEARLQVGKRTVGFVQPVLYGMADAFARDVQTGSNGGCGVAEAFPAGQGWDPVTGLGTVDFGKLLEVYLRLP